MAKHDAAIQLIVLLVMVNFVKIKRKCTAAKITKGEVYRKSLLLSEVYPYFVKEKARIVLMKTKPRYINKSNFKERLNHFTG